MTVTYLRALHQPNRRRSATMSIPRPVLAGRELTRPYRDEPWPTTGLAVDPGRRTIAVDGRLLELTRREFDLMAHLVAHPRLVFTRGQLLATVWHQPDVGDGRTIDVHVARLRTKLGALHRHMLATVRGVGYKYDPGAAVIPTM